jgi:hypothetical protein
MEDGGWRMEDGGWRMEDGGWRMRCSRAIFERPPMLQDRAGKRSRSKGSISDCSRYRKFLSSFPRFRLMRLIRTGDIAIDTVDIDRVLLNM